MIDCLTHGVKLTAWQSISSFNFIFNPTPGRFAWLPEDIKLLEKPIPAKGHNPGIFIESPGKALKEAVGKK